jgi:hypothetical protein
MTDDTTAGYRRTPATSIDATRTEFSVATGHHDEEVAREYRVGMIVEKRRPRLGRLTTATSGP